MANNPFSFKGPVSPTRKILDPPRGANGLFIQPNDNSAEREVIEAHNRERFANHFHYADQYCGNTRTFDPEGRYNCGRCNQENKGKCELVHNGTLHHKLTVDEEAGSCADWENIFAGDTEMVLAEKSPEVASYGVAVNGVGFGCHRCPFASIAYQPDTLGRSLYCGKGDFRIYPAACCALNGALTKKE